MGIEDYEDARVRLALYAAKPNRAGATPWLMIRFVLGLIFSAAMAIWILIGLVR